MKDRKKISTLILDEEHEETIAEKLCRDPNYRQLADLVYEIENLRDWIQKYVEKKRALLEAYRKLLENEQKKPTTDDKLTQYILLIFQSLIDFILLRDAVKLKARIAKFRLDLKFSEADKMSNEMKKLLTKKISDSKMPPSHKLYFLTKFFESYTEIQRMKKELNENIYMDLDLYEMQKRLEQTVMEQKRLKPQEDEHGAPLESKCNEEILLECKPQKNEESKRDPIIGAPSTNLPDQSDQSNDLSNNKSNDLRRPNQNNQIRFLKKFLKSHTETQRIMQELNKKICNMNLDLYELRETIKQVQEKLTTMKQVQDKSIAKSASKKQDKSKTTPSTNLPDQNDRSDNLFVNKFHLDNLDKFQEEPKKYKHSEEKPQACNAVIGTLLTKLKNRNDQSNEFNYLRLSDPNDQDNQSNNIESDGKKIRPIKR